MKTTFYLRGEANILSRTFPAGYPIATLETPDGVDVGRIVNALAHGLVTTTAPANQASAQGAALPVGKTVAQVQTSAPPAVHPVAVQNGAAQISPAVPEETHGETLKAEH